MQHEATPLYVGALKGYMMLAKLRIESHAHVNRSMQDGTTPLCIDAENGQMEVAKLLTDSPAGVNQPTQDGGTPCLLLLRMVTWSLQNYSSRITLYQFAQARRSDASVHWCPEGSLVMATQQDYKSVAKLLIRANADTNRARNREL